MLKKLTQVDAYNIIEIGHIFLRLGLNPVFPTLKASIFLHWTITNTLLSQRAINKHWSLFVELSSLSFHNELT